LLKLLGHEGGFVNDPQDPGGMTNLGVTKKVWESWIGRPSTKQDMMSLTPVAVGSLYKVKYWDKIRGDDLPDGVDYCVFDFAVNSGVGRASKTLQAAVRTTVDGMIGKGTLEAVKQADPVTLIDELCSRRQMFLEGLLTFPRFGNGWTTRVKEVRDASRTMAYARK
jgi:lysozyme family protein